MTPFNFLDALEWLGAIIVSVGGSAVVVLGLARWLGKRLADVLLEKDKAKYQQELEGLKAKYQTELENVKADIEKSKAQFLRYSEHQFHLYNDVWQNLIELKYKGEDLWIKADKTRLRTFTKQLRVTKMSVDKNALLIEDGHVERLKEIFHAFDEFGRGKLEIVRGVDFRVSDDLVLYELQSTIARNGERKEEYDSLVNALSIAFKQQMRGH